MAIMANIYYGFPSKKLKIIGVTGTDGKTTTTQLIYHIFKSLGKKVSMISSVYAKIGDQVFDTGLHTTTPSPFQVQRLLKKAVQNGDEYFILETTSHALDQNRVFAIRFVLGIITNITHEHLDYHLNIGNYLKTKAKLISNSKIGLINKDDDSYDFFSQLFKNKKVIIKTYALKKKADFNLDLSDKLKINITKFNKYNFLAGYASAKLFNLKDTEILSVIKTFTLPKGRMDVVYNLGFKVIVDFAHTPNAIANALQAVKKLYLKPGKKLIHVFGSAGLRDFTKRPLMGEASGKFADLVILTEEDYRTENPIEISKQIAIGLRSQGFGYMDKNSLQNNNDKVYSVIIDRAKAINKAVELSRPGDVILLTGKSHEQSLCRGKTEYAWNEYDVVNTAVKNKLKINK